MLFTDSVSIGVDLTPSGKTFTYAALDKDLNLITLSSGNMEDVVSFAAGQTSVTVAINAPAKPNCGLVLEHIKRGMLNPIKRTRNNAEFRLGEYELRARGILVPGTAASAASSPAWVKSGLELYQRLETLGFQNYPAEIKHQYLETNAHACYCAMVGHAPLAKSSLEGRLQRQFILYERGVRIKDPMDFFEEVTRYKMTQGIFPLDLLRQPEELDALVAAYTAWLATHKPEKISSAGDEREGKIVLPEKELKEKY